MVKLWIRRVGILIIEQLELELTDVSYSIMFNPCLSESKCSVVDPDAGFDFFVDMYAFEII